MFDENAAAVQALKNGQIDGLVVDLPTAFYVAAVEVDDGVIVGKLPTKGTKERFGLVLPEGQPAPDVRQPRDRPNLWANGTIKKLQNQYLAEGRRARPEVAPRATAAPGSSAA